MESDYDVRLAAADCLNHLSLLHGDRLPWAALVKGFDYKGTRVSLLGMQGIFKPAIMELPLSIRTSPKGPYKDELKDNGILHYCYRGTDPLHRDNVGLRKLMETGTPLIYFHGINPGQYISAWPCFLVRDNKEALTFDVQVDAPELVSAAAQPVSSLDVEARRQYVTSEVQRRLHQSSFRARVLQAYRNQCAICRLRHEELLEAAHILPDTHPEGEPVVSNGLALCNLHHVAFDRNILGIRPDCVVELRKDILEEADGPMLEHGLQHFNGQPIIVPRVATWRPNPRFLEKRYAAFRAG
ncbi:MAG: HNH endonuclease [Elusimicrobia bacterium]|nr:HNH endonuclease [Elusimicrobiota bacterium]